MRTIYYFCLLIAIGFVSCDLPAPGSAQTETESSYATSDRLVNSLEYFEQHRRHSRQGLAKAYYQIDTILGNYNADNARELTSDFEVIWTDVLERIVDLKQAFTEVERRSDIYFGMLQELTMGIQNEELRLREQQQNLELQKRWNSEMNKARQKIGQIDNLLHSGNDLFKVMLINTLRASLTQQIGQIQNLTIEADRVLKDLQQLTSEGLGMVQGA